MTRASAITDQTLLSFAEQVGASGLVAVEGARTRWERGGPLVPGTRLVKAPTGIVVYRPEEMTVQVRVGTLVSDLHAELAAHGQRTALPDRCGTVGGALAVGEDDVCALGVGRVRTALLQLRYVSADGKLITGGGPTVKNVSGFDLPRLMVGSLGTLGLFAEATIRTNPTPAMSVWLVSDDAEPFASRDAVYRPSAVLWDGARTWVKLEGHTSDLVAERQKLATLGKFEETYGPPALPAHRWSLRPSQLRDLDAKSTGSYIASIGTGTVFTEQRRPPLQPDPTLQQLADRTKMNFDPENRLSPGRDPAMS